MDKEYFENLDKRLDEVFAKDSEPEITVADMLTVFGHGRIGEIEFRNWLAEVYPSFKRARRPDIDEWLEEKGRQIAEQQDEADRPEEPELETKE